MLLLTLVTILSVPTGSHAQQGPPRFEIGPVFGFTRQPAVEETNMFLLGGRFSWNVQRHWGLDAELTHSPFVNVNGGFASGGHLSEGFFGARYGARWEKLGIFFKVRPGFMHYSNVFGGFSGTPPQLSHLRTQTTSPALELGGTFEYYATQRWLVRTDVGPAFVWYGDRTLPLPGCISPPPPAARCGHLNGLTTLAIRYSTSLEYRFGGEALEPAVRFHTPPSEIHKFWDTQNDLLFAGVAVGRGLDFASALYSLNHGGTEGFLGNEIGRNHAAFAAIEVAGVVASIGASYLFHRSDHHRLERATSYVHIGLATLGIATNYDVPNFYSPPPPPLKGQTTHRR